MNEINIEIDNDKTKLAGEEIGFLLYEIKIKNVYKDITKEKFKIKISSNIDFIAPSFVKGFFKEIVHLIGYEGIEKNFEFESETIPNLKEQMIKLCLCFLG